jgi:3-oxoacyl-[acyl-carrier protein] reductase
MLTNKVAIVTGAGRGIGRGIALGMAEAGANVAVIYAGRVEAANETVQMIEDLGRKAKVYQCDVSNFDETKKTIDQIIVDFDGVDILVNNAGIVRDGLMLSMSEENFDAVIATNLKGVFNTTRHLYSYFMKKRAGRIINISSVSGLMGNFGQANYSAAKAGVIGLTKTVARELSGRNVTCNAIAPGFIETDMTASLSEKVTEAAISQIPLKRMGKAEDIAHMAVFLASDKASYITGEIIKVDGGLYI